MTMVRAMKGGHGCSSQGPASLLTPERLSGSIASLHRRRGIRDQGGHPQR